MSGIGRHGATRIVEGMVDRWPSDKWEAGSLVSDWVSWIEPLEITREQADAALRECKAEGLTAYFDSHIPRILDQLRKCGRPERVNRDTGEVEAPPCPTCDGGRQVRVGDKLPLKYVPCPSCRGSGVAA